MKVAVVYNRDKKGIINVFGIQNREWYPEETIQKVMTALEKGGHTVELIIADRFLLSRLNKFLPKLSKRRANGIVFNLALGIQGKCRYTHVPAILEVGGIPYTGSSPLGHILALDKVVAKQIFMASGIPTPGYRVFTSSAQRAPELNFPLIVKPRGEAASLGVKIVRDEAALQDAVENVVTEYGQSALVEEFIEGREVNVGILGNHPPKALPVLELIMPENEESIYSTDYKFPKSIRNKVKKVCPAHLPKETAAYIQEIAVQAFNLLNVYDYGRVDIRLDKYNRPFVLEMNSMASINPASSFVHCAQKGGLSYDKLMNRIIDVTQERYAKDEPDFFGSNQQNSSETGKQSDR
jgi:D-alanine-D-alanine ligase